MSYRNKSELMEILKRRQLFAKKHFGQNFLIHPEICEAMVKHLNPSLKTNIIEIGPGLGILTQEILKTGAHLTALELDPDLCAYLKAAFATSRNFTLINIDALKFTPSTHEYNLLANIPYYITSPILNHFLRHSQNRPKTILLLMQKEVADKICLKDGKRSILSLQVEIYGQAKIFKKVGKGSFYPIPKVDSAILEIKTYDKPLIENETKFFQIIEGCFSNKRKTISNSLLNFAHRHKPDFTKENLINMLEKLKINPNARPEDLNLQDWQLLVDNL